MEAMVVMRLPSITDSTVLARSLVRSLTLTPLAQQPQLPACCEAIESQRSAIHRNEGSARYQPPYLQQQQQHNRHVCVDSVSDPLNHHTHTRAESERPYRKPRPLSSNGYAGSICASWMTASSFDVMTRSQITTSLCTCERRQQANTTHGRRRSLSARERAADRMGCS